MLMPLKKWFDVVFGGFIEILPGVQKFIFADSNRHQQN